MQVFIYGDPLGFKIYGGSTPYRSYFEGFFITSRKGKRLHIYRRENGETIYSYLYYGISESGDRPTNAFFGMSVVVDGSRYASKPSEIFNIFDRFFSLISENQQNRPEDIAHDAPLFYTMPSGRLKYAVSDFDKCSTTMEWLIQKLPQIFTIDNQLSTYDHTFDNPQMGNTALLNSSIDNATIIDALRKFSSVALSPDFMQSPKQQERPILDRQENDNYNLQTEIDPSGLSIRFDELNKVLVQALASKDTSRIRQFRDEVKNYVNNLYPLKDTDSKIKELYSQYQVFHNNISKLIDDKPTPQPPTPSLNIKQCIRCGATMDISKFPNESDICYSCLRKDPREPIPLWMFAVAGIIVLMILGSIGYNVLPKMCSKPMEQADCAIIAGDTVHNDVVADTTPTKPGYAEIRQKAIEAIKDNRYDEKAIFMPYEVGESSDEIQKLKEFCNRAANSYQELQKILQNHKDLTDSEIDKAIKILDEYSIMLDLQDEQQKLENIINTKDISKGTAKHTKKGTENNQRQSTEKTITIQYITTVGTPSTQMRPQKGETNKRKFGFNCQPGTVATVIDSYGNEYKETITMKIVTIDTEDGFQITFTPIIKTN